jgi:hypothetical protein
LGFVSDYEIRDCFHLLQSSSQTRSVSKVDSLRLEDRTNIITAKEKRNGGRNRWD